uniref:NADH dehydrogenase subunit 4L n=1 Tax=Phaeocystis globosa TaxID=33658 RepID=A0A8A1RXH3_9EUKA|nr:NADH dehydrogenase subunit 4L [Phaeocystis globosa]QST19767.1 NADH dehydrogenase subunit 4L [Phaeocystis globosa]QST19786.1 NADH dehydrogenase subunit 4L [Phaeocystis globosa]QST19805.1 NADH dehydrogenase subunit 4L [Phaeocystis globosa]QST19824.1 NADH dehydrogenase subunit 4L [Phaeocystis globosa]
MNLLIFIIVPAISFFLGVSGIIFNKKNAILILISVELMLLAINFVFLTCSVYLDDRIGQIFALLILTVAAAESSIGLGLLVVYYRMQGSVSIDSINLMRG